MIKLRGFYYITHVNNLKSILSKGILSHNEIRKQNIKFNQIYNIGIVGRRSKINPPGSNSNLWDFVNLYFQPRNAMLYRLMMDPNTANQIVILEINRSAILSKGGVFITDGNAASNNTIIYSLAQNRSLVEKIQKETEKEWWDNTDGSKRRLMAECLIPHKVEPSLIQKIYVPNDKVRKRIKNIIPDIRIPIVPEPDLFFLPIREIELTKNLSLVKGDMFLSRMQTLTISVNTVGVMGKGLASTARYQFPDVYVRYQDVCKSGELKMGKPYLYKRESSLDYILADEPESLSNLNSKVWFLLFPTKKHWKQKADIKGIENGLKWLLDNYEKQGIKSLAMPSLGCGLGWLEWEDVGPLLCKYLNKMNIPVKLYLPIDKTIPEDQLSREFLLNSDENGLF